MIPQGWQRERLGKIAELQRGFDLPSRDRVDGIIPIVSSAGVSGYHNEAKVKAPGIVTGRYGSIGEVYFLTEDFWPLNTALWVKNFHGNLPEYVYFLLCNFDFKKFSDKTGVPGVNRNDLHEVNVVVPPLPEQKKIAKIISTWDKAITTTEQLLANSQQQKKALMQQLLTGKKRLKGFSGKWQTAKLGHLTEKVGSGITPTGGSTVYASSGVPFIRSQNVLWGKLDFSDVAYINDSQHKKMSGSSVLPNDVLLNITGASIGRCCTVPEQLKTSNVNQHVCIIRLKKNLSSDYLKSFLLSHYGQKQIEQFQAGGNRQGLNFEQIKSFKIHIPEFEEQQKIAAVLSAADCEIEILQQKLEGLKQEKKALMQQLLTGKRRVKA